MAEGNNMTVGGAGSISALTRGTPSDAPLLSVRRIESANAVAVTSADTHTAELDLHNGATLVMRDNGSNALGVRVGGREVSLDAYAKQQGMNPDQAEKLYLAAYPKLFESMFAAKSEAGQRAMEGALGALPQGTPLGRTPALPIFGGPVGMAVGGAIKPPPKHIADAIEAAHADILYGKVKVTADGAQFPGGMSVAITQSGMIMTGPKFDKPVNLSELAKTNPAASALAEQIAAPAFFDGMARMQATIEGKVEALDRRRGLDLRNPADAAEYDRLARSNPVFGLGRAAGLEGNTAVGGAVKAPK